MVGFVRLIQFDMLSDSQLRAVVADSAKPPDDQRLAADILDSRDRPGAGSAAVSTGFGTGPHCCTWPAP